MSSLDYLELCRLCLVKDRVSVPIFEGEGDVRQIFLKIAACLPVKVAKEDKLPKKICDDCVYKVELFYQFWNTTANAEKQLLQWIGEVNIEDKQGYVTNVLNPNVMKQEQSTENRLDGNVMQQVGEHQDNMGGIGMMDNMGLSIPMMISGTNQQQEITSVPMDTSGNNSVQPIQAVPGPSSQTTHNQISQNQPPSAQHEDEEESSEDEDNSDDECDGDEGLPVKEESEEDPANRTIEPTTFVNVSLACDEAGPSGLQQKISDIPEIPIPEPTDGDAKTGRGSWDQWNGGSPDNSIQEASSIQISTVFSLEKRILRSRKPNGPKYPDRCDCAASSPKLITEAKKPKKIVKKRRSLLICDHCGKKFRRKTRIEEHMKQHKHQCDACSETFKFRKLLRQHYVAKHGPIFYPCSICEYKSNSKWTLKDHFVRKHTTKFAYSCKICDKHFKIKNDLKQHNNQMHSDAPPVICTVCGQQCKSLPALKSHMKYRHYKPAYECTICKRCMTTQQNLEQHMLWHQNREKVVCPTCGKIFGQKRDLDLHLRIHEGIRPFSCLVCSKSFPRRSALEQHILIHTGRKPYTCNVCGQSFAQKPGLICHRKRHPDPLPPLPVVSIKHIVTEFTREYAMKNSSIKME